MMRALFNPNDWLGRHPGVCLALAFILLLVEGVLTHA
jgi:hypothetical protein